MSIPGKLVRKVRQALGADAVAALSADQANPAARADKTLFFINGHPRSGTNWLSALVNLHPEIYCHGEFHFQILRNAMDGFTSLPWYLAHHQPVRAEAERGFADMIRRVMRSQAAAGTKAAARVIGDHTPRMVRDLLPEARYIVIWRDGRDVLVSWTYHLLRTNNAGVVHDNVRELLREALAAPDRSAQGLRETAGKLLATPRWVHHFGGDWGAHVLRDLETLARMRERSTRRPENDATPGGRVPDTKTPDGEGSERVLTLSYEALHEDTESGRRSIYQFLGVNPDLAAPLSTQTKTLPGFGREDPTSFFRKGEVGDWKNHFTADTAQWFDEAAGNALAALGYDANERPLGTVVVRSAPPRDVAVTPIANTSAGGGS